MTYKFKTVRLLISQPRLGHVSLWTISVEDLLAFGQTVRDAAHVTSLHGALLQPSEKGCKFCKAKAICPALRAEVADAVFQTTVLAPEDFDDLTLDTPAIVPQQQAPEEWLAASMKKVSLIEDWCKAVRAETERRLLAGKDVPGYKLVQGRQGPRKWADEAAAEAALKSMKLSIDEMYNLSVISPTVAEKRTLPWVDAEGKTHPPAIGPRQWKKVVALITRSEGSPSVAPASDKRPALVLASANDDFENLNEVDDLI